MIEFTNVSKYYKSHKILDNISITIEDGKLITLIGESGCGKTTTLKMINKLISPSSGTIKIDGQDIKNIDEIKLRRQMGYVIQQTGLFPHLTIRENIQIIAKVLKQDKKHIEEKTKEVMQMVDLNEELLDRYPSELSGGQGQRVGIARAFMTDPKIILMDEPFSALDPMSRTSLQDELLKLQNRLKKTIVFVTHDMDEAIKLSDKIAIMENGKIVQYDTPEMILKHPANDFVKNFIGKKRIWASPNLIKVKDIMIEHPVTCLAKYSLFYCLNKMKMYKVDSLIIIDEDKNFKGVLYAETLTGKLKNKTAADYMITDVITVNENSSIIDLAKIVQDNRLLTIPVVNDNNKLCGIITRSSLITTLNSQFLEEEE